MRRNCAIVFANSEVSERRTDISHYFFRIFTRKQNENRQRHENKANECHKKLALWVDACLIATAATCWRD